MPWRYPGFYWALSSFSPSLLMFFTYLAALYCWAIPRTRLSELKSLKGVEVIFQAPPKLHGFRSYETNGFWERVVLFDSSRVWIHSFSILPSSESSSKSPLFYRVSWKIFLSSSSFLRQVRIRDNILILSSESSFLRVQRRLVMTYCLHLHTNLSPCTYYTSACRTPLPLLSHSAYTPRFSNSIRRQLSSQKQSAQKSESRKVVARISQ